MQAQWIARFALTVSVLGLGCAAHPKVAELRRASWAGSAASSLEEAPAELDAAMLARIRSGVVFSEVKTYPEKSGPVASAAGSGVIVDARGLVLTNAHVVAGQSGRQVITVRTHSASALGREYVAAVVALDENADLALLSIRPEGESLTALDVAPEKLALTEPVFAAGFPHGGLFATGTLGPDISIRPGRVTRLVQRGGELVAIETNANIEPGNSGGPLLNQRGAVVGINNRVVGRSCLAIPAMRVAAFLETPAVARARREDISSRAVLLAATGSGAGAAATQSSGSPASPPSTPTAPQLAAPSPETITAWLGAKGVGSITDKDGRVHVIFLSAAGVQQQIVVIFQRGTVPGKNVYALELLHPVPLILRREQHAAMLSFANQYNVNTYLIEVTVRGDGDPRLWVAATLPCVYGTSQEEFFQFFAVFANVINDVYTKARAQVSA